MKSLRGLFILGKKVMTMPTVQQLIDTINAEYRNTFTTVQKVSWMNTVQDQIFQKVRHEAIPYSFTTVADNAFYPLPADCDFKGIKQVVIETKAGSERYDDLPFISIESNVRLSDMVPFYSIQDGSNLFINPIPTDETEGKTVYLYYNKMPNELLSTATGLTATPDLEEQFHELLVLGVMERIARARGEIEDKNNFAADFNALLREYVIQYKLMQPDNYKMQDNLPRRRGAYTSSKRRPMMPWEG